MSATVIDGQALAKQVRRDLKTRVTELAATGLIPGLAVVLAGEDPASAIYVRNKTRMCKRVGIAHYDHMLAESTGEAELLELIAALNADARVHGILVQLPLPAQINSARVLDAIVPSKDVDGFHPDSLGRLLGGHPRVVPCTPLGVMTMLRSVGCEMVGARALVVGRSTIVGKPMAHLLLAEHCTVTIAHSRTRALAQLVSEADIVVAAVGRPELIKGDWIKPGATVIDVGMNRLEDRLVGDVEFEAARQRAAAITPVPGGVGPMTIAMLLSNTVDAATRPID